VRTLAVLTFLALLAFTAPPARAVSATIADTLTRAVTEENLPRAVAAVGAGAEPSRYAVGVADVDTRAGFAPNTHVRVASITKTFVAATIMQLVAEGRIDLRYLPIP
jgi:D-alanyl-D-alanine carboxypeptidase